ncbi:MAG: SH3 domain-containing protein [Acidimicrobiia bacterium]|nr:SH3 domain-containing protein [Acidimicrobiia bacterium]NNF65828.1 SH3 domain-containing protein [Acidimicrobiia bacterium]
MNNFAARVTPVGCSSGPTPGAKALLAYLLDRFDYSRNGGIFNCRSVVGGTTFSEHAEGRAVDLMIPTTGQGRPRPELGDPVTQLLMPHGKRLGIQLMIYNLRAWSAKSPNGREYRGKHPHYDHVHLGMTPIAGSMLNYATIESVLGNGTPPPKLADPTHQVTTGLNLRTQPTTAAPSISLLPSGTEVAAVGTPPQTADEHEWLQIRAISGMREVEGWVASRYLVAIGGELTRPVELSREIKPATAGLAYRVEASDVLNMRASPALSGDVLTQLSSGSTVELLADVLAKSDGFHWVRVRVTTDAGVLDGWVARKFIVPIDASDEPVSESSTAGAVAELARATHRVTATSLYLRQEPTTSAAILAELPNGSAVMQVADVQKESDTYTWINVHAVAGPRIVEGWVAADFLAPAA